MATIKFSKMIDLEVEGEKIPVEVEGEYSLSFVDGQLDEIDCQDIRLVNLDYYLDMYTEDNADVNRGVLEQQVKQAINNFQFTDDEVEEQYEKQNKK